MPYQVPTFEDIRTEYLRDVKNLQLETAIDSDSDTYVRASATASAVDGLYHYQSWIARQVLPDTADPENIEYHAALRGLSRKPATAAEGIVTLTVQGDSVPPIAAGVRLVHKASGDIFTITKGSDGKLSQRMEVRLPIIASRKGSMPQYKDEPVFLQNALLGVNGEGHITVFGGTDEESHAELLARLLFYMRNPPGGGTKTDYELWARGVPGVESAKCFPLRRGIGTVDVLVWSKDSPASDDLVLRVQAEIDEKRPVACKDCLVLTPLLFFVDVTAKVQLQNSTFISLQPIAENALSIFFSALKPGEQLSNAALSSVLMGLPHVLDVEIIEPLKSVTPDLITWLRLGKVQLRSW